MYYLAKAASRYQAGPPAGQMFRKAVRHENMGPAAPDSAPEEMTHRSVVCSSCVNAVLLCIILITNLAFVIFGDLCT